MGVLALAAPDVQREVPGRGEGAKIRGERNARQFALEVVGELLAVAGGVQQAVDVIEDVPLGNFTVFRRASGRKPDVLERNTFGANTSEKSCIAFAIRLRRFFHRTKTSYAF